MNLPEDSGKDTDSPMEHKRHLARIRMRRYRHRKKQKEQEAAQTRRREDVSQSQAVRLPQVPHHVMHEGHNPLIPRNMPPIPPSTLGAPPLMPPGPPHIPHLQPHPLVAGMAPGMVDPELAAAFKSACEQMAARLSKPINSDQILHELLCILSMTRDPNEYMEVSIKVCELLSAHMTAS